MALVTKLDYAVSVLKCASNLHFSSHYPLNVERKKHINKSICMKELEVNLTR